MTDNEALLDIILTEIRDLKQSFETLDHAIRGNGTKGLKERVKDLETEQERLQKRNATFHKVAGAGFLAGLPLVYDWLKAKWGVH